MALGDIPEIPREHIPRVNRLLQKIRDNQVSLDEVKSNVLSTLGRMKISSSGVTVSGDYGAFELEARGLRAMLEAAKKAVDAWPLLKGRELFIRKGQEISRLTLGLRMKKRPATESEVKNSKLPVIEFDTSVDSRKHLLDSLAYKFQGLDGTMEKPAPRFKIRRLEELAGWMGDGWENFSKLMGIGVPILPLTTKSVLDKLGEPVPSFSDLVLKKCGV